MEKNATKNSIVVLKLETYFNISAQYFFDLGDQRAILFLSLKLSYFIFSVNNSGK